MGGSSQTTGWNYRLAWLHMLGMGPWDTFREFRGADKVIWKGRITGNTALTLSAPKLWGGDKDQGGVEGTLRLMFGEADQLPNAYATATWGPRTAAYRGFMTAAWEGGIWGANNPWAQKCSYRGERYIKGWDNDDCWYPSKCPVPIEGEFTPGTPGAGTYRWAIRHNTVGGYVAASPEGIDWSEENALPVGLGAEINHGEWVVSTSTSGATSFAPYTNPAAWVAGGDAGATAFLAPRVATINGEIWHSKGLAGYARAAHPAGPYEQNPGRAHLIAGNEDFVVRYHGPNAMGASDGYHVSRLATGDSAWEHVWTIPLGPEGSANYAYYLDAADGSPTRIALAGSDFHGNSIVFSSTTGFSGDVLASEMPPGQLGAIREIRYVGGTEWLALVYGGTCADGPSPLLRSTDNLASFQRVELDDYPDVIPHFYMGNMAVDRVTGRVIFVASLPGEGFSAFRSDDRNIWQVIPLGFGPNSVYLIGPNDSGTPPHYGRFAKNPAHMILEAHSQQHAGRQPRGGVDLAQLTVQADWFFSRGFGLCTTRNSKDESPREFIKRIEKVAGCSFTKSLDDGLWHLDVANGIYDLESLPVINDDHVLKFKETGTVPDNAVNSVSVKYFDPERKETIITPPVRAMGLIAQFGEIHQTFDYPEVPIGRIALEIATRELLARITPTRTFELDCNPGVYRLRKNQPVRLQLVKRGIADMICYVGDIPTSGSLKSGAFTLKLTQDIYSLPTTEYVVELGEDTSPPTEPAELVDEVAFEAPYIDVVAAMPAADFTALPEDAGYVVAAASNPGRMRNFTMMVAPDGGEYDEVDEGEFCPSCTLTGEIQPGLQIGIGYENARNMAAVQVGTVGTLNGELVRVDAHDLDAQTLNLGRGCGDTLPRKHDAGSVILFYQVANGYDRTQHIAGETVQVKLLTNSFTQQMPEDDAEAVDVTFKERLARPYNNADMKINGVSIFAIGTSTPGGGGPGGGGPTTPPAQSPGGGPASPVPGTYNGFPDDAPYPIPSPTVFGLDVIDDGGFTDPASLAGWRDRLGNPLASDWEVNAGRAQFSGSAGDAYGYAWRMSISPQPFPRYSITVTMKVQTTGGLLARVGVAWGTNTSIEPGSDVPNNIEADAAASYLTETTVSYTWELQRQTEFITAYLYYGHVNFMPVVQFGELDGAPEIGTVDDATMVIAEVPVPTTPITLDHLDFDTGLADWDLWPDPSNPYAATVTAAGGELSMSPTHELAKFANAYCVAPIDAAVADAVGKYIVIEAEVWCDDPSVDLRGRTSGGAHMFLAPKTVTDGYAKNSVYVALRGDWTVRRWWYRINAVPTGSLLSYHVCSQMKCELGYSVKVRNITAAITDSVMD